MLEDIRAVGACLSPRVHELIADFYVWLSGLPEFARSFPDERLLTRVKRQQEEYWRDFLRAEVDDSYVQRRRIVGEAHARIELGLLIYLQAMAFVSKWLRREIQIDERLVGRTTAIFSIRKLIEFDSAVVVDTYARQTSGKLERQRERLQQIADVMRAVTEGDLARRIDVEGPDDVLGASVNDMVQSLGNIAREMGLIAQGDYSTHFAPRSDKDDLGKSLQAMTAALQTAAEKNRGLIWITNAQSDLGEAMSGNPTVEELSRRVLSHLCRSLDAQVGTQYVVEEETQTLRLAATYATSVGDGVRERWRFGEGLIGQAAAEKRPEFSAILCQVRHYITIASSDYLKLIGAGSGLRIRGRRRETRSP